MAPDKVHIIDPDMKHIVYELDAYYTNRHGHITWQALCGKLVYLSRKEGELCEECVYLAAFLRIKPLYGFDTHSEAYG